LFQIEPNSFQNKKKTTWKQLNYKKS
jgi:hypothetical protein